MIPKKLFSIKILICITTIVYLTKIGKKLTTLKCTSRKNRLSCRAKILYENTHNHQGAFKKNG
jgi:ABC-type long-subunit fatty acid transport system fused permease/ATPase subunit